MYFDVISFYQDNRIPYETEGYKHTQPGWVNIECPFCTGSPGLHLGFNLNACYYHCWRCGGKSIISVIEILLKVSKKEAFTIFHTYNRTIIKKIESSIIIRKKAFKLPSNMISDSKTGRKYLENRGFDPLQIEKHWGIQYTSMMSSMDEIDYRFRVLIPIYWNDKTVSFDTRDFTGKAIYKYKACPLERELIPRKSILYGKQSDWKETGIAVEGPIDVWRFGVNSFATFGITFTAAQIRVIANNFKRVPVVFDGGEKQAKKQADKLVAALRMHNIDSFRVDIEGDPGEMKQNEADYIVKQLIQ